MDYYYITARTEQNHSSATNDNLLGMTTNECLYLIIRTDIDSAFVTSLSPYDEEYIDPEQYVSQIWMDVEPNRMSFSQR